MKKLSLNVLLVALVPIFCVGHAQAQNDKSGAGFPLKPINLVVPYPPGGTTDILARIIGNQMSEDTGQPVIVVNKPGAGGNVGSSYVAKASADGYTLLLGTVGTQSINKWLYKGLNYDPERDFKGIVKLASVPNLLVANPKEPYGDVKTLITYAKAHPGEVNFASAGAGGSTHLAGELFKSMASIDIRHIPYKGSSAVMTDIIGGQVQITFDNLPSVIQHVRSGKLKALAVTGAERTKALPNVPTVAESGLPGYDVMSWFGIFTPVGTPSATTDALIKIATTALSKPAVQEKIALQGAIADAMAGETFDKFIAQENVKWKKVVDSAKVTLE